MELSSLVGLVDGDPPDPEDLDDLRLPGDVAVFFGGDITIPMELLAADHALAELSDRHRRAQLAERFDEAEWISADDCPASHLTAPTLAVQRRHPLQVCGVVLHADDDGRLGDMVLWLTVQPENNDRQRSIV